MSPNPPATSVNSRPARVVVVGNPNAGKSTLFNGLTGGQAQVGNFPGTTVTLTRGRLALRKSGDAELLDVPGFYSLAADRPDERVALDAVLGLGADPPADALVIVLDGPRLSRSLYVALQLLELGLPTVVAVNLLDEAQHAGLDIHLEALQEALGVPVVGTVARRGTGLAKLAEAVDQVLTNPGPPVGRPVLGWPVSLAAAVAEVAQELPPELAEAAGADPERCQALARWLLLSADERGVVVGFEDPIPAVARVQDAASASGQDLQSALVATRYAWIDAREDQLLGRTVPVRPDVSEQIDRVALHPILGSLLFLVVTGIAFSALFSWADPMIGAIEALFGWIGGGVASGFDAFMAAQPATVGGLTIVRDLVVDGLIGGVGGVIVFLPQIALLFLFLAILEDCGYLARASHLADRVLRAAGLPGAAFVPLLSGYACAVPAILATRTMPRLRDRLLTMMVLPLTSCSARLPVYTLLIAALFPATLWGPVPLRPVALAGMYLFSTLMALGAAVLLGRFLLPATASAALIELPPYRWPQPRVVLRLVWSRCREFLREAGGIILLATVVLWGLLYFPRYDAADLVPASEVAALEAQGLDPASVASQRALERSFGGRLGKAIEPVIEPLGYDWKIGVGLIGAFAAREVFVSTLGVVYGVGSEADETSIGLRERIRSDQRADGSVVYTPLVGLSIMVFFALSLQCLSTMAVLRKESRSWGWPLFTFAWMMALAYGAAFLVYQGGRALGYS